MAQPLAVAIAYSLTISHVDHNSDSHTNFPNITTLTAHLHHPIIQNPSRLGYLKAHILDKGGMEAISPSEMWSQCWSYDNAHPDTKLNKIGNFLANESFPKDVQPKIDAAKSVLYIEEAYIEPEFRRKGLSLLAVELLICQLELDEGCIAMLQAGSIARLEQHETWGEISTAEASEKITRHWKRIGFSEWSDSDDAWLCLWTSERPGIRYVVPELFCEDKL